MIDLLHALKHLNSGTFVDIGANLGQTLVKLKSVRGEWQYLALEPNPACVVYLKDLIRANGWRDVQVMPVGVSSVNSLAELQFYYDNEAAPGASVVENFRPEKKIHHREYVALFTFDEIVRFMVPGPVAIVKIDVEGAELDVLLGLRSVLTRDRPMILMEILPTYGTDLARQRRQAKIEKILGESGYKVARILKNRDDSLRRIEVLGSIGDHSNLAFCDYLCLPNEHVAEVDRLGLSGNVVPTRQLATDV